MKGIRNNLYFLSYTSNRTLLQSYIIVVSFQRLPGQINERNEKLKTEMLGEFFLTRHKI